MLLYHEKPVSKGVENAIKRAKQMVEVKWTPVRRFSTSTIYRDSNEVRHDIDTFISAYYPQQGVNYSSVRCYEKFVGDNVLFETYLSALSNPRSVMYTRSQHGQGRAMSGFYGTVCTSFAAYVFDLPVRFPSKTWSTIPGVTEVDAAELENLQLCDAVLKIGQHIAIITDIQRDVEGKVRVLTVSESTSPGCVAKDYTPEEFRGHWLASGYRVFRYAGVHDVPYTPDPFVPVEGDPCMGHPAINTVLQPDYGNKANYMLGDTVELDIMEEGWTSVEITGPEAAVLPIEEDLKAIFRPSVPGYYTACCVKDGEKSALVEFRITNMVLRGDKTVLCKGDTLELSFETEHGDKVLGWIIQSPNHAWRQAGFLSDGEYAIGKTEITVDMASGENYVFVMAEGAFGRYRSPGFYFHVEE
ncbi:MAG: hypothetical protein GX130_10435 [Candidatus Hydrogenedens sp.]|nr:hypothetical protein [Candidatus Hydrogenedens sp.]